MKKVVLLAVVAAFAASPALAAKKSKKMHQAAASAGLNDNSKRFVRDALPIFLPSWALPIYMHHQKK